MNISDYPNIEIPNLNLFDNDDGQMTIITQPSRIAFYTKQLREKVEEKILPESWVDIGVLVDDRYLLILRDLVQFSHNKVGPYIRLIDKGFLGGGRGVAILPKYGDKILVLRQFRHSTRRWSYNVPRGFAEKGRLPEDQAYTEMKEEVSGVLTRLVPLGAIYPDSSVLLNRVHLFFADITEYSNQSNDPHESANAELMSIPQFESAIRDDLITDGYTIAAYAKAKLLKLL